MPLSPPHAARPAPHVDDPALPTATLALDAEFAQDAIARAVARPGEAVRVLGLRVARHEPGRRLVVDYDLERESPGECEVLVARASIHRGRSGRAQPELLAALRAGGFGDSAPDAVSVPEPLGHVPELRAALRRRVGGLPAGDLAEECYGPALLARVAAALHKLHGTPLPARRVRTVADEMAVVRARVAVLGARRADLAGRLLRVLGACNRLAATLPLPRPRPGVIHDDLTGEQVLADGGRLWLVGFDDFCAGDPALDAGTFLGHLAAQAVRDHGDPAALAGAEAAFEKAFLDRRGREAGRSVHAYAVLALVRDLEAASRLPDARDLTDALLEVVEGRLDVGSARRIPSRSGRSRAA